MSVSQDGRGALPVFHSQATLHSPNATRLKIRASTTPSPQMATLGLYHHIFKLIHPSRFFRMASPPFVRYDTSVREFLLLPLISMHFPPENTKAFRAYSPRKAFF